jgi:predicted phosphodiesterase
VTTSNEATTAFNPTTVTFAGDWHANLQWARKAIAAAGEAGAEVIVHLGDFGYDFSREYVRGVERALDRAGVELWFVDGNHEQFPVLESYPIEGDGQRHLSDHISHLPRGYRWEWSGVRFLAMGGAYSIDRQWRRLGESWWSEETITDDQVQRATVGGPADVLVAHDCPTGVVVPGLDNSAHLWPPLDLLRAGEHREQLRRVVDAVQPRVVWHGHYHRQHDAVTDFGYGPVAVHGLDCDETTLPTNLHTCQIADLEPPGGGPT